MPPDITVLLAVYNGQAFLRSAIDSILAQSFTNFELLVMDDGSTDATATILASYADPRLRVLHNPHNIGLTRSLNVGLRAAHAPLIARMDADDIAHPTRLERQLAFLRSQPTVVLVGAWAQVIGAQGQPLPNWFPASVASPTALRWGIMFRNPLVHSSVMFRRAVILDQFGGYNEAFRAAQDYELWLRLVCHYDLANLPEVLIQLRVSAGSVSVQHRHTPHPALESAHAAAICHILQIAALPAAWLELLTALRQAANSRQLAQPAALYALVQQFYRRFTQITPAAHHDADVQRAYADLLTRIAYYGATADRASSLRAAAHAWRIAPSAVWRMSPAKYAARLSGLATVRRQWQQRRWA